MQSTYFVDRAIGLLKRRHDRPFAMIVGFYDPHSPFRFPSGEVVRYRPSQFSVPPVSEQDRREQPAVFASLLADDVRGIQAAYFNSLAFVDAQVGRLMQALDDVGLSNHTLVVYVGDNGYMLGEHGRFEKHCFYEPAVHVPLIMRWPGHLARSRRISALVEMVDVLPTVLSLLRLPVPPRLHGLDLGPLLEGKPGARARDLVFSEYLENEEAMVRSERYKLVVGTGARLRQDGYLPARPLPGPYQSLFDLEFDPGETKDASQDPRLAAVKEELLDRMFQRMVTTREGLEPVPLMLSLLEAIHWCLIPRDQ
jgi:choline-sulfatase